MREGTHVKAELRTTVGEALKGGRGRGEEVLCGWTSRQECFDGVFPRGITSDGDFSCFYNLATVGCGL